MELKLYQNIFSGVSVATKVLEVDHPESIKDELDLAYSFISKMIKDPRTFLISTPSQKSDGLYWHDVSIEHGSLIFATLYGLVVYEAGDSLGVVKEKLQGVLSVRLSDSANFPTHLSRPDVSHAIASAMVENGRDISEAADNISESIKESDKKTEKGTLEVMTSEGHYLNYQGVHRIIDRSDLVFFETNNGTAGIEPRQVRDWKWTKK